MLALFNKDRLLLHLAGAVTTTELQYYVGWKELLSPNQKQKVERDYNIDRKSGSSSGITNVVIADALKSTTYGKEIVYYNIINSDTAASTITVSYDNAGTIIKLIEITLDPNDSLVWTPDYGFVITDHAGKLKITAGGAGGINISAGTTQATSGTVIFSNANGVTFGLNAQTLTASVGAGAAPVNFSAGTTSNNLGSVVFSNSNGVSFGLNGSTVTGSVATSLTNMRVSAGTTSNLLSAITFSNSNGVTFGLNGSTLTGSIATSLTNINLSAGTTSNNLSAIVFSNSNDISFGLNGSTVTGSIITNGISAGTQSVSTGAVVFSNSNGISFGMSGSSRVTASYTVPSTAGLISNINISAGITSNNLSAITFSDGSGVTFGLNGSTLTASVRAQTNANFSAGTTSNNLATIVFSNSNGVSFGLNGSTFTASVADPMPLTLSFIEYPSGQLGGLHAAVNSILSMQPLVLNQALTATVADIFFSISLTTSGTANTSYSGTLSMSAGLYSLNAGTLSLASSGSQSYSYSYTSNVSTSVLQGVRKFTIPINVNATKGNWWYGLNWAFSAGSGSITFSIIGASNAAVGNYSGMWGSSTNSSNQFVPYAGVYSASTGAFPASIGVSEIYAGAGNATQNEARPTYIIFRNISAAI